MTRRTTAPVRDETDQDRDTPHPPTRPGRTRMTDFRVLQIPQCDGRYRVVALAMPDWRWYQADRAILDSIRPLGCLDVTRNGLMEWGATGPRYREIDPVVRHALRAMLGED